MLLSICILFYHVKSCFHVNNSLRHRIRKKRIVFQLCLINKVFARDNFPSCMIRKQLHHETFVNMRIYIISETYFPKKYIFLSWVTYYRKIKSLFKKNKYDKMMSIHHNVFAATHALLHMMQSLHIMCPRCIVA